MSLFEIFVGVVTIGAALLLGPAAAGWLLRAGIFLVADGYGREKAKDARDRAKAARDASLRDRFQMVRSGVEIRSFVYGEARVSGPVAYAQSTGPKKEFLHMVVCLAGHQSSSIKSVLFNDIVLPAEDGNGFVQSGEYFSSNKLTTTELFAASSFNVANNTISVESVTRQISSGGTNADRFYNTEILVGGGVGYSHTIGTKAFTIVGGFGEGVWVNYTYEGGASVVRLRKFLGATGQAAAGELVSESGGKWTSVHRLSGITYLYARLEYNQNVFGQVGLPNISAVVRGKLVYDPRKDSTVAGGSGSHRVADPTTWEWSENPALCVGDFLRDATYGMGATAAQVPALEIFTAANICDALVTIYDTGTVTVSNGTPNITGSGTSWKTRARPGMTFTGPNAVAMTILSITDDTHLVLTANYVGSTGGAYTVAEKRYTCNGALSSDRSARDNLESLLESMAGSATWIQGRWLVLAGAHTASQLSVTESMMTQEGPEISVSAPRRDLFNRIVPTYAEKEKLYTSTQAPAVTNATYLAADGGIDLPVEITYEMVTGGVTTQRLAKIFLERSRQALTVTLNCNLMAYDAAPGTVIDVTIPRYGWTNKLFEVLSRTVDFSKYQVKIVARETASGVWDWNKGAETAVDLTPNTDLPSPFTAPSLLNITSADSSYTNALFTGIGAVMPRLKITWTASTDIFVLQGGRIQIQTKLDSDVSWSDFPSVSGDSTVAYLSPIQSNRIMLVRLRAVNSMGRAGLWATFAHTTSIFSSPGQIGGGNLISNSGFELDTSSDGLSDSWVSYGSGSYGVKSHSRTADGVGLSWSQRSAATLLGTSEANQVGIQTAAKINISGLGGGTMTASAYVSASANLAIYIVLDFYTVADAPAGTIGLRFDNTVSVAMRRVAANVAVPTNATKVLVTICMAALTGRTAGAATLLVDNVQLESGNLLTGYAPRTDEVLSLGWDVVTGTNKPADYATADVTLVNLQNTSIRGNTVTMTGAGGSWANSGNFYSKEGYTGGVFVSFSPTSTGQAMMIGLDQDPTEAATYGSIDYCIYCTTSAKLEVYESNVGYFGGGTGLTYAAGDVLSVVYDGQFVRYVINGVIFRIVSAPSGMKMYVDSAMDTAGAQVKNIQFGPLSSTSQARGANLVDSSWWAPAVGDPTTSTPIAWTGNKGTGTGGADAIIYDTLADGSGQMVWKATQPSDTGGGGGGWNPSPHPTNRFDIDPKKTYMFACYFKRVSGTGYGYWGPDQNSFVCTINTTTPDTGNYFVYSADLVNGKWYLAVGWIYPYGSTGNSSGPAGFYDCQTGAKLANGLSFNWNAVTNFSTRAYQYYGSAGAVMHFASPQAYVCDGSEPNLSDLLSMGGVSARNQLSASNIAAFMADLALQTAQIAAEAATSVNSESVGSLDLLAADDASVFVTYLDVGPFTNSSGQSSTVQVTFSATWDFEDGVANGNVAWAGIYLSSDTPSTGHAVWQRTIAAADPRYFSMTKTKEFTLAAGATGTYNAYVRCSSWTGDLRITNSMLRGELIKK